MKKAYTVSSTKNSDGKEVWYAHRVGYPNIPVMSERGTFGTKRNAMKIAADSMGISYKEYIALR